MSRRRSSATDAPLLAWGEALRTTSRRRKRIGRRACFIGAACLALLGSALLPPAPRLVWNASASAPMGLYAVSPDGVVDAGDMVVARPPVAAQQLAAVRHYLPRNVPLVKRVAAVAGDDICASGARIMINGRWVASRRTVDRQGRVLPHWHGCVRLHGRQIFLLNADPASFDGRYFGMTQGADVIGRARLLWAV